MDGDEENEACFADSGKNTLWNFIYCLSLSNKGRESPEILLKHAMLIMKLKWNSRAQWFTNPDPYSTEYSTNTRYLISNC